MANSTVNFFVDIIAKLELLLVKPATNTTALKGIVQSPRKGLVGVAVTDEARVELNRLIQE